MRDTVTQQGPALPETMGYAFDLFVVYADADADADFVRGFLLPERVNAFETTGARIQ